MIEPGTPPKWANPRRWQSQRGQIHAGGEAGERIPRERQRHVERVDVADADVAEQVALSPPIDLGLGAGDDLEAAVQPSQRFSSASASSAAIRGRASATNTLVR
jgi:hypothetical protein